MFQPPTQCDRGSPRRRRIENYADKGEQGGRKGDRVGTSIGLGKTEGAGLEMPDEKEREGGQVGGFTASV